MKTRITLPLFLAGLLLAGCTTTPVTSKNGVLPSDVTVVFQNPEKFRDLRESLSGSTDETAIAELRSYLEKTAPAHLQTGQKLTVTFTDIDLAGDFTMAGGGQMDRVRIIKGIYIPRMEFTFAVTDAAGATVKEGKRTLSDMNFQANSMRVDSDRAYFYDKMLLEDWLRDEFKP